MKVKGLGYAKTPEGKPGAGITVARLTVRRTRQ